MRSVRRLTTALLCVALVWVGPAGSAQAQDFVSRLRHLSFALTDHPPDREDARALATGEVALETLVEQMLESEGHRERVKRYFHDWFGTQRYPDLGVDASFLVEDGDGIYQPVAVFLEPCAPEEAVETTAWWSDDGPVKICPQWVSDDLCIEVTEAPEEGEEEEEPYTYLECGGDLDTARPCGRDLVGCFPIELSASLAESVSLEFARRAFYAYTEDLSWMDLLGGDFFFGNRLLYFYYLWTQTLYPGFPLGDQELETLRELPLLASEERPFPSGPERAGVVTSPTFLTRFNNFRSRVRALTNQLLCHDVDGSTNIDQTQEFLNPDFTEFDLSHGGKPECAYCHYAMDNQGSMLMGWAEEGVLYEEPEDWISTLGHAFGETGDGPAFLVRGYIERAPGFAECMARTAWQDISGASWDDLSDGDRAVFLEAVNGGPRTLLRSVMTSELLRLLRN